MLLQVCRTIKTSVSEKVKITSGSLTISSFLQDCHTVKMMLSTEHIKPKYS